MSRLLLELIEIFPFLVVNKDLKHRHLPDNLSLTAPRLARARNQQTAVNNWQAPLERDQLMKMKSR